jgi:plasmid stabilization system protein ParE
LSTDYVVAPAAIDDIDEIAAWMLEKDPASDLDLRFVDMAYETFEFLVGQPGAGHKRQDLTSLPVLFCTVMKPFTSFVVVYRGGPPVEIVRVTRWARDLPTLLADEGS